MVASNIRLPNIRRMFCPDPGYVIVDADLRGADAQVVAWETGDEDLKSAFKKGVNIHIHNARTMWAHETRDMTDKEILKSSKYYKPVKIGCHAVNYGASANALVHNIGWTKSFAEEFRERWFFKHPKIREWHKRYERHLQGLQCWNCYHLFETVVGKCTECGVHAGRTVKNQFGFRRIYFERVDGKLLPNALAWTPQSTVIFCSELGWTNIAWGPEIELMFVFDKLEMHDWKKWLVCPDAYDKWHDIVQFLIQVHDSIVFQVPFAYQDDIPEIVNDMLVKVPYKETLIIPMGFKVSRKSWGDCK